MRLIIPDIASRSAGFRSSARATSARSFFKTLRPSLRRVISIGVRRRVVCLGLILGLLIMPGPGIAANDVRALASTAVSFTASPIRYLQPILRSLFGYGARPSRQRETLSDRVARVARIRISPRRFVAYQGQSQTFGAVPANFRDETVQGVKFSWESSDPDKVQVDAVGRATFLQPGLARIICRAGTAQASAPVLVRPGRRPRQSDLEWWADQQSLIETAAPSGSSGSTGSTGLLAGLIDKMVSTAEAQTNWPDDFGYDELWSEPRNLVGSPRNRAVEATRTGAVLPEGSNFEFAVPIVGLGGRNVGTDVKLFYNSRVWSRRNNAVAFDAISGWPGPGFSLGFGRVVFYTTQGGGNPVGKYLLIDADGTQRYLGTGTWMEGGIFQTSDGTHITYNGNARYGGTLIYKSGTFVSIIAVNNRLVPTQMLDTNGNIVQVSYKPECYYDQSGGHCGVFPPTSIDYITDTLGRLIQFQYDANGKLTSITAPGFGGTAENPVTQTLAQFDYQTLSVSYNFNGLTVEHLGGGDGKGLRHVYFPATNTGYLFTYSGYGMIHNVSVRRSMTINGSGVISDGTETASVALNYPTSGPTQLTDVPAFTQRTENATNAPQSIYTYSISTNGVNQTKTFTITQPDSTTVELTRSTNAASVANGLLTQSEVKIGSASLNKSVCTYANDGGGSPQVQSVIAYDDQGTPVKADFDYDALGNMTNKREYGYQVSGAWQVRRRSRWTYTVNAAGVNLQTEANVYHAQLNTNDADDVMIAKTTYAYDNYASMGGMEDYGGTANPPGYVVWTDPANRGNVTGVTEWTDLQAGATIQHLAKYDIFGNVVKAQVSCCQEKDLTNTEATYWSQPDSETSGDPNGVHTTTSIDYDFNTSLPTSSLNAAGLTTTIGYNAALQASSVTLPTGANADANFDYGTLSASSTQTYDDLGTQKTLTRTTQYDGWGRAIYTVSPTGAQVNTTYDAVGRVISRTNPFQTVGSPGPATTIQYDVANRAVITTLPGGNTIRSDYAGSAVTVTDQVNRKVKRDVDGLGRLIKVTEPTSTGTLTQETLYSYSLQDKLTQVNQGNQTRSYKHDARGRLIYEKIPEQTASINDGTGTMWTSAYAYTEYGAIKKKTDARGVESHYAYDALHNVTQIWFTGVGGDDSGSVRPALPSEVAATEDRNFVYTGWGALSSVTISNKYTETFAFDDFLQVSSVTRWILGQTSDTRKTYTTSYEYNLGNQLSKMIYPSGQQVSVNHDDKGRMQSLTYEPGEPAGYLTGMSYDIAGQVTGLTLGNGTAESYGYDANRLQMTSQTATKGATSLMNLTYDYQASAGQMGAGSTAGNAGQLMTISGTINSTTESASYLYDLLGRLTTSTQASNGSSAQRTFAYDRWGNRTAAYDDNKGNHQIQSIQLEQSGGAATNKITSVTNGGSTVNYTYDAAGNVTNDGLHSYSYDAENRMVSVDSGATAQYRYDHQNRRVTKIVGSNWTHYIWHGSQVIGEHDATTAYSTNPTYQVKSARLDYIYSGGRLIQSRQRASGSGMWTSRYFLSDRLSARVILDTSGNVVGRQAHLPFGEDVGETGTQEKHHLANYERDAESATDYAVNRQYSISTGRFTRTDPLASSGNKETPQSWNRYAYTAGDPINMRDPVGLDADWGDPCGSLGSLGNIPMEDGWGFSSTYNGPPLVSPTIECWRPFARDPQPDEESEKDPIEIPEFECEVQLRFLPKVSLPDSTVFHAYIVLFTFQKGSNVAEPYPIRFRGGPDNEGYLRGSWAVYQDGDIDWGVDHLFIRSTRLAGPCSVYQIVFQRRTNRINNKELRYLLVTQNSNAYAYTILLAFGLTITQFTNDKIIRVLGDLNRLPGWGENLLD